MLEKPNLDDERIVECLRDSYALTVSELEFLPIGYDSYAGVYRVRAGGQSYFLKVKRDSVNESTLRIPRFLNDQGIEQVVAPIETSNAQLCVHLAHFTLILYPFVQGESGKEVGLSDSQWVQFGTILNKLHSIQLPPGMLGEIPHEDFVPHRKWSGLAKQFHALVLTQTYEHPAEQELAAFWRTEYAHIRLLLERTEALGRRLQEHTLAYVLCHADIHTANLLVTPDDKVFVVDWDQPMMAPKERDFMFVTGATLSGFEIGSRQEELFYEGYGKTEIDLLALAYYRYEWAVQDIGAFGEQVFTMEWAGDLTKQRATDAILSMFGPNGMVTTAIDWIIFSLLLRRSLRLLDT
jgi:spectinomycin phosphotransferase